MIDLQNPTINFKKVGAHFIVVSQNNQNICIYDDQLHDLKQVISVLEKMFSEDDVVSDESKKNQQTLDLLVAGKLEEYESSKNDEEEPDQAKEERVFAVMETLPESENNSLTETDEISQKEQVESKVEEESNSYAVPRDEVKVISSVDDSSDINNIPSLTGGLGITTTHNVFIEDNSILKSSDENPIESVSEKKGILDKILGKSKKSKK